MANALVSLQISLIKNLWDSAYAEAARHVHDGSSESRRHGPGDSTGLRVAGAWQLLAPRTGYGRSDNARRNRPGSMAAVSWNSISVRNIADRPRSPRQLCRTRERPNPIQRRKRALVYDPQLSVLHVSRVTRSLVPRERLSLFRNNVCTFYSVREPYRSSTHGIVLVCVPSA